MAVSAKATESTVNGDSSEAVSCFSAYVQMFLLIL